MRLVKDWGGKTGLRTVGRPRKKAGKKEKVVENVEKNHYEY